MVDETGEAREGLHVRATSRDIFAFESEDTESVAGLRLVVDF
jgi:hypothetical protein